MFSFVARLSIRSFSKSSVGFSLENSRLILLLRVSDVELGRFNCRTSTEAKEVVLWRSFVYLTTRS